MASGHYSPIRGPVPDCVWLWTPGCGALEIPAHVHPRYLSVGCHSAEQGLVSYFLKNSSPALGKKRVRMHEVSSLCFPPGCSTTSRDSAHCSIFPWRNTYKKFCLKCCVIRLSHFTSISYLFSSRNEERGRRYHHLPIQFSSVIGQSKLHMLLTHTLQGPCGVKVWLWRQRRGEQNRILLCRLWDNSYLILKSPWKSYRRPSSIFTFKKLRCSFCTSSFLAHFFPLQKQHEDHNHCF